MARADAVLHKRWNGGQLHNRLSYPPARVGDEAGAQRVQLGARGIRPDDQALAAGAVNGLHHELVEAIENLFERTGIFEPPGVDIFEHRFLAEVIPNQIGQVGVDEFVVGYAVTDGVGDRHVSKPSREQEPRRTEHRIGAKLQRVKEFVVDAAIDHIDPRGAGGGAHPDPAAGAEQVAPLHQLDAHQPRQQGVFEIGGVVDTGGQNNNVGLFHTLRGACPQSVQQLMWVFADRPHPHADKKLGQSLRHHPAVGDHVAHAGWDPHIVFQYPPVAGFVPDQVNSGYLDAHSVGRLDAGRLTVKVAGRAD